MNASAVAKDNQPLHRREHPTGRRRSLSLGSLANALLGLAMLVSTSPLLAQTANTTTKYTYDALDRLTQVTDPSGLNTTYQYDGLSDPTSLTSPDTGVTARTYDAAGNVLTATDAKGILVTYTYDALNRRLTASYPDSTQNIAYHYDEANSVTGCSSSYPIGRLTRIVENSVTTVYCYDAQGRVIEKQQIAGTTTNTTGYAYTAAGRLSGIVYPSGTMVTYARDSDGRIQSLSVTPPNGTAGTAVSSVTYQPFGPVSGYTLGNGQAVTRTYDANYRLTDLTSPAFSLHVTRDAMGDITAVGNAPGANPATETYSYDPLYRLTAITEANGSMLQSVTYNPTGDRLSKTGSGQATGAYSYNANTHQLVATGSYARSVDADGNTTAITAASGNLGFGYNDRNRMILAQVAGSTVGSYTYDALGERIAKDAGGSTKQHGQGSGKHGHHGHGGKKGTSTSSVETYSYDESQQLLSEQGTTNRDYIWMGGIPVANVDTSGTTSTLAFVTADQQGTPRAISDASGTTEWTWPYGGNAWGESTPTSSGYIYNLRFAGQYYDQETGLNYNVNRDYDSGTGRYIEFDPLGLKAGPSGYAYVANAPLNGTDPFGFACNARGCWNTPNELASASVGDYAGYYAKACAGGDPYACRAGEVATDTGDGLRGILSEVTNRKLDLSIAMHQPESCPAEFRLSDLRQKVQNIRIGLMNARIDQLSGATPDNPLQVNKQDISAFHHAVFEQNGAGADAFGGDLWDATHLQGVTGYNWCESPACKP